MKPTRRAYLTGTAALAAALVSGCTGGGGEGSGGDGGGDASVAMTGSQFRPRNARVEAGATVTWTNEDSIAHTVTAASENWSKDTEVQPGGETSHAFESDGVYDVYCRFHGAADLTGMSMKIAVGDADIASPLGDGGMY